MTAILIDNKDLWDKFVEDSPEGLLFHRWDFLKLIEQYTDYKFLPYGINKGNDLICVFPIFFRRYMSVNMVFSPPPQTAVPYLGPIMSPAYYLHKQRKKESYVNIVAEDIERELNRMSPNYTNIRTAPNFLDIRSFKWEGYNVETFFTYTIDLKKSLDEIWSGFGKDCRERINRFSKLSPNLKESDDLNTFYDLSNKLYKKQGLNMPLLQQSYLRDIMHKFPDNLKLYFLTVDDNITDIEGVYEYKDHFKLLWGVTDTRERFYGCQEFSTWELIKKAKKSGYKDFEIVGANTKRICEYQSKFNPALNMYFSASKLDNFGYFAQWCYSNLIRKKLF
jgi:hypothetical protein